MAEIDKIIFPTDFSRSSQAAISWVKLLAADLDVEVHCIYVLQDPTLYYPGDVSVNSWPDMNELEESSTKDLTKFVKKHLGNLDTKVESAVLRGRPADEIATYAGKNQATMIVMSTHGHSGIKHLLMGSTTEGVLRQAQCPVLAIPHAK